MARASKAHQGGSPILMRAGIPLVGGQMVAHARKRNYPLMISANAFSVRHTTGDRKGTFRAFRKNLSHLDGLNCALDSAGFVAAVRYGGFPWEIEEYCELAASRAWTWASAPDLCCEPQIASDRAMRLLRIAGTARLYGQARRITERLGGQPLMPVLQGWEPQEYRQCFEWMPIVEWPELVGIGSVCRRHIHGPNGLITVLREVDSFLPPHCKLHLFGVKSSAIAYLVGDGRPARRASERYRDRILSLDSMAWEASARVGRRTGRTMEYRLGHLDAWMQRQDRQQQGPPKTIDPENDAALQQIKQTVRDIVGMHLAKGVVDDVIDYDDARMMLDRSSCWASAYAQQHGLLADIDEEQILEWLADTPI